MNETTKIINALGLIITMWGMGMTLLVEDFKRVLHKPKAVLLGLLNQLIILPLIAFTLLYLMPTSPEIAIGIVLTCLIII